MPSRVRIRGLRHTLYIMHAFLHTSLVTAICLRRQRWAGRKAASEEGPRNLQSSGAGPLGAPDPKPMAHAPRSRRRALRQRRALGAGGASRGRSTRGAWRHAATARRSRRTPSTALAGRKRRGRRVLRPCIAGCKFFEHGRGSARGWTCAGGRQGGGRHEPCHRLLRPVVTAGSGARTHARGRAADARVGPSQACAPICTMCTLHSARRRRTAPTPCSWRRRS